MRLAAAWSIAGVTGDTIEPGRISLNVVSSWWKDEAAQYGAPFDVHDARYARTEEWLSVLSQLFSEDTVSHTGPLYQLEGCLLEPKPAKPPTDNHPCSCAEARRKSVTSLGACELCSAGQSCHVTSPL